MSFFRLNFNICFLQHAKTGSTVINNNEMRVPRGSWTRSK